MQRSSHLSLVLALCILGSSTAVRAVDYFSSGPGQGSPDTLDDVWQAAFNGWGLSPTADTDGDGCSNYVESLGGTDPRNPSDCVMVGNMAISAGNVVVTFRAEKGKQYRVWESDSPALAPPGNGWTQVVGASKVSTANHANDSLVFAKPVNSRKFYRLEVLDADTDNDGVSDWAENRLGSDPAIASSTGNGATDGDTIHSLLTLTAAPVQDGYERDDVTATTPAAVPAKIALTRSFGTMALNGLTLSGSGGKPTSAKADATAGADYTLGTVNIPANQGVTGSPYQVSITPTQDATDEVPEFAKITVTHPLTANLASTNATVVIRDADPTNANNNQLYVAFLGHEAGVATTASGVATAFVKGDNTSATINVDFSGLSSTQNTAYIRYGDPNNENNILQLPLGHVTGQNWNINSATVISTDQAMLDALRTGNVSVMISTAQFTTKEIFGYFNRAVGSTAFNPARPDLAQPVLPGSMTPTEVKRDIFRFLGQCTFGATTALYTEINNLVIAQGGAGGEAVSATTTGTQLIAAYTAWLDKQMDIAQTPSPNYVQLVQAADNEEFVMRGSKPIWAGNDPQYAGQSYAASYDVMGNLTNPMNTTGNTTFNNNHPFHNNRRREWWTMVLQSKDQVRQRMAAALQEIVVISENDSTVQDRHYGCANYWDMLAQNAFGKYRTILENVTYSPMMGVYLSHIRNRARYISGGVEIFPDENYAREIMQLFSIGLVQRHPDGSLILDGDGLLMPTYDQTDITELARVMTGFCIGARHASATVMRLSANGNAMAPSSVRVSPQIEIQGVHFTSFSEGGNEGWWQAGYMYPMKLLGRASGVTYHDFNYYVAPDSTVSSTVSKVLFAGKRHETQLPFVDISGLSDAATHAAADNEMRLALNALAGDPTSASYTGHPNTSVNISRWLIQRLTSSNPSPGYIYRVQQAYESSNGNLGLVLKAILLDYEARSLTLADSRPGTGRLKEPMMHYAEMLRGVKAFSNAPLANLNQMTLGYSVTDSPNNQPYSTSELNKFPSGATRLRMADLTTAIGQSPQKAPSVFNWFLPDYVPPGNMAAAGLFAPEIMVDNETNLVNRVNRLYSTFPGLTVTGATPGFGMDDFTSNAGNSAPELLTDVTTLTFDASNWNTPQTVIVTGYDDFDPEGTHTSSIWHATSSADAAFNNITTHPLNFTINDNETTTGKLVSIVQSGGTTSVIEGGAADTYTVVLTAPPTSGQTVTVTPDARSPYFTTSSPAASGDVNISPASVTFNDTNWATPQTITVTANDDVIVNGYLVGNGSLAFRTAMIRNNVTSGDADYNGYLTSDIVCNVFDNDGTNRLVVTESTATGTSGANGISVVTEGSTTADTFTVGLAAGSVPTANVTVTLGFDNTRMSLTATGLSAISGAGTTTASATLTFAPGTYTTAVTVSILAVDDAVRQGVQFYPITFSTASSDAAYAGLESKWPGATARLQVRVNDNDSDTVNGFTWIAYGGANNVRAVEGGMTAQYLVCLNKAPSADVTATWIGSSGDVSGIGNLTFTTANWFVPQAITVTGNNDIFVEPTRVSPIRYTFAGGGYDSTTNTPPAFNFTVVIGDDDLNSSAGVTLTESSGSTAVSEAGPTSDTFDVVLTGQPNSNVVFAFTAPSSQVTVSPSSLTFNPGNWSTAQTVTVTAVDDALNEGSHSAIISTVATSLDTRFSNAPVADVNVTIADNDTGGAIILAHTGGDTTVSEGGTTDTINVTLAGASAPAADVTVTLINTLQFTFSPSSLTFTPGNYATPQVVTVTAVNDTQPEPILVETITASTNASQPAGFTSLTATLPIVELDNDDMSNAAPTTPAVQIITSNGASRVVEGGMTDTIEVVLRRAPLAEVSLIATFGTLNQLAVDKPTLTFNASNWNIPQTVTITAIDDAIAEGPHSSTVIYTSTVSGNYTASDTANITCSIGDNEASKPAVFIADSAGLVSATPLSVSVTEGSTFTYKVSLGTQPTTGTTVTVTPSFFLNQVNGVANTTQLSASAVTFTSADSPGTQKTVTVTATSNTTAEPTQVLTIQNATTITSNQPDTLNYNGMVANDLVVTVNDDDSGANRIGVTESGGSSVIMEESGTDTIDVVLVGAAPASNVTVNLAATGQVWFSTGSAPTSTLALTFTPTDYATPQTVTLVPFSDIVSEGIVTDTITLSTPSSGPAGYTSLSYTQVVRVLDNDDLVTNSITVLQSNTNTRVIEGGMTDTFEVYLRRQPTGTVTITPSFTSASQVSLSPNTLTFNANNWATPQTVTVTATDDANIEGAHSTNLVYSASGGGYLAADVSTAFTISIGDNEASNPSVMVNGGLTPVSGSVTEGGATFVYTVTLGASPASGATVTVTPSSFFNNASNSSQLSFNPTSLTFTQAAGTNVWNRATTNTFTVTATDDAAAEALMNMTIANTITVSAGTDARYAGIIAPDVNVALNDNETARLVGTTSGQLFGTNTVIVAEDAGTDTLQVSLAGSAPVAGFPVTVSVARAGSQVQFAFADGSTSTAAQTLTFTDANYNIPQTLTIMSAVDTTVEGVHTDTINITTSASQPAPYASLSTAIPVRITDNDDQIRALISIYQTGNITKVIEGGATDTYSVVLRRAPTASVVLTPSFNPAQLTLSASALTFTTANWNIPQNVTVTAVDDNDIENVHTTAINYTASMAGGYLVTDTTSLTVTIGDNEMRGTSLVTVTQSGGGTILAETSPGPSTDTYTLVLGSKPTGNVTITPQAHNPLTGISGTNLVTFSPASITFTPLNWDTPQTVTISLANDAADNNTRFVYIGHRVSSTDLNYATYNVPGFTAVVGDDDSTTVALSLFNTGGFTTLYETGTSGSGTSDTVWVVMRKKPTATVTVTPTLSTTGHVTFSPATLSFTTTDWNIPHVLTLTAVNDAITDGNPATYTLTCTTDSAGGYTSTAGTLTGVSIYDSQSKLVITPASTTVGEGGTTSYTVALSSAPTTPVTVTIITQKHARQNGYLAQQFGYFAGDGATSGGLNQQRDNMLFDWSELTTAYTTAYTTAKGAATETTANAPTFHLAASKAVIDLLDLWWCGGRMKAKWPDGTAATVPPSNPRQPIIDAVFNAYSTTTLSTAGTTYTDQVRDRCRWAIYLVGISPPAIAAH